MASSRNRTRVRWLDQKHLKALGAREHSITSWNGYQRWFEPSELPAARS